MTLRFSIEGITTDTSDWTCKVQIVDMIIYDDAIDYYADKLILLDTYLISIARMKVSLPLYERLIHKFYWVVNKEILIEHVKPNDELEKPVSPLTKLNTITFASIAQMTPGPTAEIGISLLPTIS
ncbi:hypothetical protein R3W88_024614 [Solanum pinnatisectum]|uniref:Uncharacterized protein n=1 Tax=Solanum pinnatisectum TaxID=50273 RepID=A0AAV9M153_9SOLN|nr:hypothetical protein R3W88_024614 [Solanum pinnatisectum]